MARRSTLDEERTWLQIRYGRGNWPGREATLIAPEVLVPMVAPGVSLDDGVIELRGERPGWRDWSRNAGLSEPPIARLSVDSMEHALTAAQQGLGAVLGSAPLARSHLASGVLLRLDLPELETKDGYWLTWPEERARSKKQNALIRDFAETLRAKG